MTTTVCDFADVDAFYADDPARLRSPECDYGVWWRLAPHECPACWSGVVRCRCMRPAIEHGPELHPVRDAACDTCEATGVPVQQPRWRVTLVVDTGEVVAVRQDTGEVRLLHRFDIDATVAAWRFDTGHDDDVSETERRDAVRHVIDGVLDGWADVCGGAGSLGWITAVLAGYPSAS